MNKLAIALIVATIVVIALVMYFLIKQETAKAQSLVGPGGGGGIPQCTTYTNIRTITYVPPVQTTTYTNTYTTIPTTIPVATYTCL
ncbi:MAG: hypothetical protein OWQ50_05090 [Acidianus infernus]|nr:hypothetical protein [Acidianus infernus]